MGRFAPSGSGRLIDMRLRLKKQRLRRSDGHCTRMSSATPR